VTRLRAVVAAAAATLVVSWWAASRGVAGWEVTAGRWAHDLPDGLTPALEVVMQAGTRVAPVVVAAALLVAWGWRWRAAGVLVAGVLAWPASWLLKALVDRPRPTDAALGRAVRETADRAGFPSSHTAIATAVVVAILLLGRPRRAVATALLAVPVLTAVARLHLGVHWALDVVGGAAIGVLLAIGVAYLVGLPPGGPVPRSCADDELVVASFNVRNGRAWDRGNSWPLRSRAAAVMARDLGADILAVQEAFGFQGRFLAAALPGYEQVGRGRGARGGEWCPVYVRTDRLRVVRTDTRWFGDTPDTPGSRLEGASFPRIGTHVRLAEVAGGRELEIVNTHLDERSRANRLRSVQQLVGWLDPTLPRMVVGDLNATLRSEPELFAVLTEASLADALPADAAGTAHDYRGGTDHRRIDHIFVSGDWTVVAAGVVADDRRRRFPSDHWPVVARLRWREG
jgi:endonuclease/exonuclease/phosphatase family metal-dependent hydrolase/membrane-associated phospholipid phosphatase